MSNEPTPWESVPTAGPNATPGSDVRPHSVASIEVDKAAPSENSWKTEPDPLMSLSPSIRDYNFENKRRYHKFKEGRYLLPNDDPEQEREDMKHALIVNLCDGALHNAPLNNPRKILDIGTGTGIWAIDMGDDYPDAEVTGIDLSPIQPPFVPPNVMFTIDDVEADWLYPDNSIDFVHVRNMAPAVKDWPRLVAQAYKALKPGGWIELVDMAFTFSCDDGTVPPDFAPVKTMNYLREALDMYGVDIYAAWKFADYIREAGFVNERFDTRKVPVGTWPRDPFMKAIGDYCRAVNYDSLGSITNIPFRKGLGWTNLQVEVFLVQVRKDLLDDSKHSYNYFHSCCGQKPYEADG
ncbi:hypothetical protein K4K60_000813 [Colletotrichum sp. SAR11_57]|nr:hypothetical protein K4K60_000813 [Colletotrichum sp. SAR11_57]